MNEITIKGELINTKSYNHRRTLGNYGEMLLQLFFIKHNIIFKNMNDINEFSRYDFNISIKDKTYIIELKTRIGNIENHSIEIIDYNKVNHYLKENYNIIFVFNHIETEDIHNFFYYEIDDFERFKEITFLNTNYKNYYYELNVKYLKKLEDLFKLKENL